MAKRRKQRTGVCALTQQHGVFVKSHLLPKALTRLEVHGERFWEGGEGRFPIRPSDSWYDPRLVIRKGEDILSALDDWAIAYLRGERLVWSGCTDGGPVPGVTTIDAEQGWGVREVQVPEPDTLRRFFLSLLWRAAATDMRGFDEIEVPPDDLDVLRRYLVREIAELPIGFYRVTLTQLIGPGELHNNTPFAETKRVPDGDDGWRQEQIFRFYIDGLIAHILRTPTDPTPRGMGPLAVGADNRLIVSTNEWAKSRQVSNLEAIREDTYRRELERAVANGVRFPMS